MFAESSLVCSGIQPEATKKAAVDTEGRCSRGRGESSGTPERNTLARLPWRRIWRQDLHRGCESIRGYGGAIARVAQNPQWKIQGQEQEMARARQMATEQKISSASFSEQCFV